MMMPETKQNQARTSGTHNLILHIHRLQVATSRYKSLQVATSRYKC